MAQIRRRLGTLDIALGYIAAHVGTRFIFPLAPGRKGRPLIKDNLNQASNDPRQIKKWHDRWPGCAWGCACKKSGIVCVDIDTGNGKQGMKSVHSLRQVGFLFPNTEKERSPSGGWHLVYRGEHHFSASKIGLHIDTPNYFLFAGNVRYDGKAYVEVPCSVSATPAPDWIAEKIEPRRRRQTRRGPSINAVPIEAFRKMLGATPYAGGPDGLDDRHEYDGWLKFAMACHEASGGNEGEYLDAFIDWCLGDPNGSETWTAESIERHWHSFAAKQLAGSAAITRASWFKVLLYFGHRDLVAELEQPNADFVGDPLNDVFPREPTSRKRRDRRSLRRQRAIAFARE
jgi:hypothetical protein